MYRRDPYQPANWLSVPNPANAPEGAATFGPAALLKIEQGISQTLSSIHDSIFIATPSSIKQVDPLDADVYPKSVISFYETSTANWDYGGSVLTIRSPNILDEARQLLFPVIDGSGVDQNGMFYRYSQSPKQPTWIPSHAYTVDSYVQPRTPNGWFYKVTTAGTSGNTNQEPVWPTTLNGSVTDQGGVIYQAAGRHWSSWFKVLTTGDTVATNNNPIFQGKRTAVPGTVQEIYAPIPINPTDEVVPIRAANGSDVTISAEPSISISAIPPIGQMLTLVNDGLTGNVILKRHKTYVANSETKVMTKNDSLVIPPNGTASFVYLNGFWIER